MKDLDKLVKDMQRGGKTGHPVAEVAAGAGAVALAGVITAAVLIAVGVGLLVAGIAVLGAMLVAGASIPFAVSSHHRHKRQRKSGDRKVLDVEGTVRVLGEAKRHVAKARKPVSDVLRRVESGEISPDEAIDELK